MASADIPQPPETTGNLLVVFEPGRKPREVERLVANAVGARLVHSADFVQAGAGLLQAFAETGALSLDRLGVAVITPQQADFSTAVVNLAAEKGVRQVRPEFWMYALETWEERHAAWVQEGLSLLSEYPGRVGPPAAGLQAALTRDQSVATWGLVASKVLASRYSGAGIKVAVLDTGFDLEHPDFTDRLIVSQSFVPNQQVQDLQGHGTHCIGTACGPKAPENQIRYGVAYDSVIHAGKVLDNSGSGQEGWILAGIEWAVQAGCEVISMSLGRPVQPGEPPDPVYENAGRFALDNGSLIIAAAGNESWRQFNIISPVGAPANSESIMAVGAVDVDMKVAEFSCGGLNFPGGEVDIAAPGVDILSSFPMPKRYERLSGTSMATPHVAGIAALYAESDPSLRGRALWSALQNAAGRLPHPARDVGAGLAAAPAG